VVVAQREDDGRLAAIALAGAPAAPTAAPQAVRSTAGRTSHTILPGRTSSSSGVPSRAAAAAASFARATWPRTAASTSPCRAPSTCRKCTDTLNTLSSTTAPGTRAATAAASASRAASSAGRAYGKGVCAPTGCGPSMA
jgi:hypothetical protein